MASARAMGGSYRSSAAAGATAVFRFSGTQATWITARGPSCGQAQVIVDGHVWTTVDLYNPTLQWQYAKTIGGLASGAHIIQIRVLGTHRVDARGATVVVDGFRVP
jgi:hypothetical protein